MKNKAILWVVPLIILIILNLVAFLGEVFFAKMSWEYSLLLRGSTIAIDGIFIGLYTYIRLRLRKKLRHKLVNVATIYWADTIAALSIFYSLYVLRLALFLYLDWITKYSFIVDIVGVFLVAILFGWLLAYITKRSKKYLKKWHKKEWFYKITLFFYPIFYLFSILSFMDLEIWSLSRSLFLNFSKYSTKVLCFLSGTNIHDLSSISSGDAQSL